MKTHVSDARCGSPGMCVRTSFDVDGGFVADDWEAGLEVVHGADLGEGEPGISGTDGLEGEGGEIALTADTVHAGWARGVERDEAIAFVAVREGYGLAVFREEVAGVYVDELEDGRVELKLEGDGGNAGSVAKHDGDLEGAADSLAGRAGRDGERDGRGASSGPCCGQVRGGCRGRWHGGLAHLLDGSGGGVGGGGLRAGGAEEARVGQVGGGVGGLGGVVAAELDLRAGTGVDGGLVQAGEDGLADDVGDEQEDDFVVLDFLVLGREEEFEERDFA